MPQRTSNSDAVQIPPPLAITTDSARGGGLVGVPVALATRGGSWLAPRLSQVPWSNEPPVRTSISNHRCRGPRFERKFSPKNKFRPKGGINCENWSVPNGANLAGAAELEEVPTLKTKTPTTNPTLAIWKQHAVAVPEGGLS